VFAAQRPALPTLGQPLELIASGIIFKPYPSGAPTHAAVDAALALRRGLNNAIDRIARVTCFVHPWNAMTLREEEPHDPLQAKVNLRYCVAAALLHGRLTHREFSPETLADPLLQALICRVHVTISQNLPDNGEFPAELRIETTDGALLTHRSEVPPGGSSRPLSEAQLIEKMHDCATDVLASEVIEQVVERIRALDTLADVAEICELLEGRPARDGD